MPRFVWALTSYAVLTLANGPSHAIAVAQQIGASRTVLATVVDNRGRTIVDIDPDDFVIRETGQLREVLSARVADYPIVVVLDNAQDANNFETIRQAAARFIGRVGHRPVGIALAEPPEIIATLDDDRAVVMHRLEGVKASSSGQTLLQGVVTAARAIQELGAPFSAIVVVSATPVSSIPAELLTPILESGATVHVVIHGNASGGASETPPRSTETLRALTEETHGQFTTIYAAASYQAALDRLADRLAPELMVEYLVPVGSSSGNDVQLGVRIAGARVNGRGVSR
jgi:hypothetical protein